MKRRLGKIWKRGKHKFRYAYENKEKYLLYFVAGVGYIYVKDIMSDAEKSRLMDLAYAGYRTFK